MTHIAIRQDPRQMEEKSAMLDLNRSVTNQNLWKFSNPQAQLCSFVMSPPPSQSSSSFQVSIEIVGAIHSVRLWRRERAREGGREEGSILERAALCSSRRRRRGHGPKGMQFPATATQTRAAAPLLSCTSARRDGPLSWDVVVHLTNFPPSKPG